jgi:hypothetical protein
VQIWLKSWGTGRNPMPTGEPWWNRQDAEVTGQDAVEEAWFSGKRRVWISPADILVYYAVGHQYVFGIAEVVGRPYTRRGASWPLRLPVRLLHTVPDILDGVYLPGLPMPSGRYYPDAIRQKAYVEIKDTADYETIVNALQQRLMQPVSGLLASAR